MTVEGGDYSPSSNRRNVTYCRQLDFLHIVADTREQPTGTYTRSRKHFWEGDIVPVTLRMRDIFPGQQSDNEVEQLHECWSWLQEPANRKLVSDVRLTTSQKLTQVPWFVVLNKATVQFWGMMHEFNDPLDIPVMYNSRTVDWEKDIRLSVTDFVFRIRNKQAFEVGRMDHAIGTTADKVAQIAEQIDMEYGLVQRADHVDTISWMLLMNYHMELLRREKAAR